VRRAPGENVVAVDNFVDRKNRRSRDRTVLHGLLYVRMTEKVLQLADCGLHLGELRLEYLAAINAFDIDAAVATFAPDAYVNDARREINGIDAIRQWITKEMGGDHVTMEPREVVDHYGETIVRSRYDRTYDKTNLPAE
jgi:SnoaL-like domain